MMFGQQFALLISLVVLVVLSPAVAFQQTPRTLVSIIHRQQHRLNASSSSSSPTKEESIVSNTFDNNPLLQSRRNVLLNVASNVVLLSAVGTSSTAANADVIRSAGCANGEGDACADLAEGNEFIQSLQKKSAQNKEANQRVRDRMFL
jgi:hypothetical protein